MLISTIVPESITLSSLLAYIEMYGNRNTINSARDHVRPLRPPLTFGYAAVLKYYYISLLEWMDLNSFRW